MNHNIEKVFSDIERTCICLTYIFPFNFCLLTFWCCCPFLFLSVAVVPLGSFLVLFPFRFFLVLLSLQILCWYCCPFRFIPGAVVPLGFFLVLLSLQVLSWCCCLFRFVSDACVCVPLDSLLVLLSLHPLICCYSLFKLFLGAVLLLGS